jgi:hypothetical protein
MKGMRILAGIILFGSLWGMMECVLGDYLHNQGIWAGAIMTGFMGFGLMAISRRMYGVRGMQLGMGLIAGVLKYIHPVGGCMLCSAIAIAFEGAVFEIIWYSPKLNMDRMNWLMKASMGVISGYIIYSAGYVITHILTPVVASAPLYLSDLAGVMPVIFSSATIAGLAGGLTLSAVQIPSDFAMRVTNAKKEIYYPVAYAVSAFCWIGTIILS